VEFPKIAVEVWQRGKSDAQDRAKKLQVELDQAGTLKKKLLPAYLGGKVEEADYQSANADYKKQIADLERQFRVTTYSVVSTAAFLRFAELHLSDLSLLWKLADDDQRRRVQTILFRGGVLYSQIALACLTSQTLNQFHRAMAAANALCAEIASINAALATFNQVAQSEIVASHSGKNEAASTAILEPSTPHNVFEP
jgi:hypothetical protein